VQKINESFTMSGENYLVHSSDIISIIGTIMYYNFRPIYARTGSLHILDKIYHNAVSQFLTNYTSHSNTFHDYERAARIIKHPTIL
jgi:hypothetical protein